MGCGGRSGTCFATCKNSLYKPPMQIPNDSTELPTLSFFGDASSRNCNFMVLGGVAIAGHRISEVEQAIADIREEAKIKSEFHWKEYRGGARRAAYQKLCRYGFSLIHERKAELHVIITDFTEFNHRKEKNQTKDASINKIYWQLCLHRLARFYGKKRAIHIRLDAGDDCADICKMRNQLCAAAFRTYSTKPNCIRSIEPISSERSGIIQLADVLIGGIASKMNKNPENTEKGRLAEFIRQISGRHSWEGSTPKDARLLTVWHHET